MYMDSNDAGVGFGQLAVGSHLTGYADVGACVNAGDNAGDNVGLGLSYACSARGLRIMRAHGAMERWRRTCIAVGGAVGGAFGGVVGTMCGFRASRICAAVGVLIALVYANKQYSTKTLTI